MGRKFSTRTDLRRENLHIPKKNCIFAVSILIVHDMANRKKNIVLDFEIDKLTNSIENTITGDSLPTEISLLTKEDLTSIKKGTTWSFDWSKEYRTSGREIYKLTVFNNPQIVQGLMSLEAKTDHIYMHLLEAAPFNRGKKKMYLGVPGNLVAYACKVAFERGFAGYVAFDAKTALIRHYQETLFATHFRGTKMYISTPAALRLTKQYFP